MEFCISARRADADLTEQLLAAAVVFGCMDELSAFAFAPPSLKRWEERLLKRADLVLTGGRSLYRAKVGCHECVHCFPSSVDTAHFKQAREEGRLDPLDPELGLVRIAAALEQARGHDLRELRERADVFLAQTSWDRTWQQMDALIEGVLARRLAPVSA